MEIPDWTTFSDELRQALSQACPTITWQVEPYAEHPSDVAGVVVLARRDEAETSISLRSTTLELAPGLAELVDDVCRQAEESFKGD